MHADLPSPVAALGGAVVALLRARAGDLALDEDMIDSILPRGPVTPVRLPVVDRLVIYETLTAPSTESVVRAVGAAAEHLHWRRTYSAADGFAPDYLERYGWFDLAGPEGPFMADGLRIYIGCWGEGLRYPDHSHAPEEHYLVVAGGARFRLADQGWRTLGPGGIFHTPPGAVHSADMRDQPLMAIAIWRAEDLSVRINLTDADRNVVAE